MPTLPIVPVTIPAVLAGQSNGRLSSSILVDTPGQAGGATVRLVEPAARAWRAMSAEALARGHVLKPTSLFDSYRPYEIQERIFLQRYTQEPNGTIPRLWDSDGDGVREKWYLQNGNAPAAVPSTSNHGWGLAVDVGEERDGDTGTESMDALTLQWLANNELRFGWSHELAVEPWHIRYWAGDNIPDAVLEFEEDDMTQDEFNTLLLGALNGGTETSRSIQAWMRRLPWQYQDPDQPSAHNILLLEDGAAAVLRPALDALLARPPVVAAPVDPAAIEAAVRRVLAEPDVLAKIADTVNDDAARRAAE